MAATRTALGTWSGDATATGLTGVALAAHDTLIVEIMLRDDGDHVADPISGVTWNGQALTESVVEIDFSLSNRAWLSIWTLEDVSAATGDIVVSWGHTPLINVGLASALNEGAGGTVTFDQSAHNSSEGGATSISSGATPTTTAADEFLIGAIGRSSANGLGSVTVTDDVSNTGQLPTPANNAGGGASLLELYDTVSATGTYAAGISGTPSTRLLAAIATYAIVAAAGGGTTVIGAVAAASAGAQAASVQISSSVAAALATATATGKAAIAVLSLPASLGTATTAAQAANVQASSTLAGAAATASAAAAAAAAQQGTTVMAETATASAGAQPAGVVVSATVSAALASATATAQAASAALGQTVSAATAAATAAGAAAGLAITSTVSAALASATAAAQAAAVVFPPISIDLGLGRGVARLRSLLAHGVGFPARLRHGDAHGGQLPRGEAGRR